MDIYTNTEISTSTSRYYLHVSLTHRALAALHSAAIGRLDTWLQQNHDGLPQKERWLS